MAKDGDSVEGKYNAQTLWVEVALGENDFGIEFNGTDRSAVLPLSESDEEIHFRPNQSGSVGDHFALLGQHDVYYEQVGCQQIFVVVPDEANNQLESDPETYAEALAYASREIGVGHRHRTVAAFVAPQKFGPREGYTPHRENRRPGNSGEFYISPNSTLTSLKNTWIHEYIHTRQGLKRLAAMVAEARPPCSVKVYLHVRREGNVSAQVGSSSKVMTPQEAYGTSSDLYRFFRRLRVTVEWTSTERSGME